MKKNEKLIISLPVTVNPSKNPFLYMIQNVVSLKAGSKMCILSAMKPQLL